MDSKNPASVPAGTGQSFPDREKRRRGRRRYPSGQYRKRRPFGPVPPTEIPHTGHTSSIPRIHTSHHPILPSFHHPEVIVKRLSLLLALCILAAAPVSAQHPQTRAGFWFNFGLGYGSLGCD